MAERPIYLDYMATTPVDPRVIDKLVQYLGMDGVFGNPASTTHLYGIAAQRAVEEARIKIAETIQANPREIVFTSGATEANNLALIGAARFYQSKGRHIITVVTEHKAVLDSCHQLEQEGFDVTYLPVNQEGILDLTLLEKAIRTETILVSIMHVNNEIGVIQDIAAVGELLKARGIIFHVDAAQSAGKLAIDVQKLAVDLISFSAHKNYGPKGIGALFVRQKPRIRLQPQSFGGGHEGGLRSGTLATHQIVAMAEAFVLAEESRLSEQKRILHLRNKLWQSIKHLPNIRVNGSLVHRIAGNLNVSFAGIEGDSLLLALKDLAISSTSACASASSQPSYVLKALGLDNEQAFSTVRFSIGRFTTEDDVDKAGAIICKQLIPLYELLP